jgi:hypothetical protein
MKNVYRIMRGKTSVTILSCVFAALFCNVNGQTANMAKPAVHAFQIPADYLREQKDIPSFWISTVEEVTAFLKNQIHKGKVEVIGKSAGGRPIYAVLYGQPREGKGTTTFSGSLGYGRSPWR